MQLSQAQSPCTRQKESLHAPRWFDVYNLLHLYTSYLYFTLLNTRLCITLNTSS